jgi:hypothetical protein
MSVFPDPSKVITEGHLTSHFDHELGVQCWEPACGDGEKFSWTTKVAPPTGILDDPELRKRQTVDVTLVVSSTAHDLHLRSEGSYVHCISGEVSIRVPYEAIDGIIEALQMAKAAVPEVVAEAYSQHEAWLRQCEELNKSKRKKPQ